MRVNREKSSGKFKIGLAGCGVVACGVAELLRDYADQFSIDVVLVRDLRKSRADIFNGIPFVDDLSSFFDHQPDIVIDVLSSGDAGHELTRRALEKGIHVVSANKQALADDLVGLHKLASENDAVLAYSASVGGGTPMIETVRESLVTGVTESVEAVVNGTVNFILTELATGADFDNAVKTAQDAGFAEADPSADLSGADAVAKAKILAWNAFGKIIEAPISCEELDDNTRKKIEDEGGVWRQLTEISLDENGTPQASVKFRSIAEGDFFWDLNAERNAIKVYRRDGEVREALGRGAGAIPTGRSILGDLLTIADT